MGVNQPKHRKPFAQMAILQRFIILRNGQVKADTVLPDHYMLNWEHIKRIPFVSMPRCPLYIKYMKNHQRLIIGTKDQILHQQALPCYLDDDRYASCCRNMVN